MSQNSIEFYKKEGYAIFKQVYSEDTMALLRAEWDRRNQASENQEQYWFGDVLEQAPDLMLPIIANPLLLDFAEKIFGPFVQLDNLTLAVFPSEAGKAESGTVSGWHRDRWSNFPTGTYEQPSAFNAISYLQDMTDELGPLRIVPQSHIHPVDIAPDHQKTPHPDEVLVYPEAGDVVFTHNRLLHSGTVNVSGQRRYFFSIFYNHSWFKHTDDFSGPNCQAIIANAREQADHRTLRLLGVDDHLQQRANSGFLKSDTERWAEWAKEDEEVKRH